MSFASGGGCGSASSKSSGTTLAVGLSAGVSVGELLVVFVAWDNETGLASDTGAFNQGIKCEDSQGNLYSQLYSQTTVGSADHARGALFVTLVRSALTTSDTVTLTCQDTLTAKAAALHKFTLDVATKRWAVVNTQPATATNIGSDPSSLSLSGLTSKQYLMLHVLAAEGPDTDAYTWDSDYTQITGTGTTGGAADSNMHVRGGYRIATLTGDTVDVTSTTADRDYVQGLVALCEVDYDDEFPSSEGSLLDDFNRANENPLSGGGAWDTTHVAAPPGNPPSPGTSSPGDVCALVSNGAVVRQTGHIDNNSGSWRSATCTAGWDQDVYATCRTIPSNSSVHQSGGSPDTNPGSRGFGVILGGPLDFHRTGVVNGVEAKWERDGRITVDDHIRFGDVQSFTVLPFVNVWAPMADGDGIGIQRRCIVNHLWINQGSGWEWIAAIDDQLGSVTMSAATRLGLEIGGTETIVEDFGGGCLWEGCVPRDVFRPQIYRRVFG